MKRSILGVLVTVCATLGCRDSHASPSPSVITPLSLEQLQQLLPYMTDLTKRGDVVRRTTKSELSPGQTLVQHQNSQVYTFSLWVDQNQHPVMPPKDGSSSSALRPVRNNGTFEIICIGGCTVNTSGGQGCTIVGCEPVDNSCGCTPIDCPGCLSAGCLAGGSGALAGSVRML